MIFILFITGNFRLVNGDGTNSGRLELLHNGTWGTICDYNFDHLDALVACRYFGYRLVILFELRRRLPSGDNSGYLSVPGSSAYLNIHKARVYCACRRRVRFLDICIVISPFLLLFFFPFRAQLLQL